MRIRELSGKVCWKALELHCGPDARKRLHVRSCSDIEATARMMRGYLTIRDYSPQDKRSDNLMNNWEPRKAPNGRTDPVPQKPNSEQQGALDGQAEVELLQRLLG